MMNKKSRIYVAGHRGMVGSAIVRELRRRGYSNLILRSSFEVDLRKQDAVREFFRQSKPEYVFMAAAHVGGIMANAAYPADFLIDNLEIENNIFRSSYENGVKKLLFLGSACMMPRLAEQPMKEESVLTGSLEPTNEAYAIAKIAGVRACEYYNKQYQTAYTGVIPANCYGINDSFDSENSHVIPALIRKYHEAEINGVDEVVLWGTGKPKREFLYVDDLADACVFIMNHETPAVMNIGSGNEISMKDLAEQIGKITGFRGRTICDLSKPDGMPRRIVDTSRMDALGWKAKTDLKDGLETTYRWYLENICGQERKTE